MRSGVLAILVGLVVCGASAAAVRAAHYDSAARAGAVPCGPAHAHTLAVDRISRVYQAGGRERAVYGCVRGGAHAHLLGLGHCPPGPVVYLVGLTRAVAAYVVDYCGVDTSHSVVVVRRLSDGVVLHQAPAVSIFLGPESGETVTSLVVKPDGAVAWIASGGSVLPNSRNAEVQRVDRRGQMRLDSGRAIVPGSLRLSGSRLTWLHGRTPRSASLR